MRIRDVFDYDTPYPVDALPPIIRNAVEVTCAETGIHPGVVASSALMSAATAVQGVASVQFSAKLNHLRTSAGLSFLIASYTGLPDKMFCDWLFAKPLRDAGVLFVNDTPKLLAKRLANARSGLACATAWQPFALGGFAHPEWRAVPGLLRLIRLWDSAGGARQPGSPYGIHISMGLHISPSVLSRLLHSPRRRVSETATRFLGRFLPVVPDRLAQMSCAAPTLATESHIRTFQSRLRELLDSSPVFHGSPPDSVQAVWPAHGAIRPLAGYFHEYESGLKTVFVYIQNLAGRAPVHILRLATVLSVFSGNAGELSLESLQCAHRIVRWHIGCALRLGWQLWDEKRNRGVECLRRSNLSAIVRQQFELKAMDSESGSL